MSDVFSIRWRKNPSEIERTARGIIEEWQSQGIHYDMIFSAVIDFAGEKPMTESGLTRYLGQLADKLDQTAMKLHNVGINSIQTPNNSNQVVMEFDPDFDDAMLSEWDE